MAEEERSPFEKQTNPVFYTSLNLFFEFMYCKHAINIIEPNWGILFLPLDAYVWILLLITAFLVAGIFNRFHSSIKMH
jgi:hypothetical protein